MDREFWSEWVEDWIEMPAARGYLIFQALGHLWEGFITFWLEPWSPVEKVAAIVFMVTAAVVWFTTGDHWVGFLLALKREDKSLSVIASMAILWVPGVVVLLKFVLPSMLKELRRQRFWRWVPGKGWQFRADDPNHIWKDRDE